MKELSKIVQINNYLWIASQSEKSPNKDDKNLSGIDSLNTPHLNHGKTDSADAEDKMKLRNIKAIRSKKLSTIGFPMDLKVWAMKTRLTTTPANRSLPKIPISVSKIRHRQDRAVMTPFLRFKLTRTLVSRPP